VQLSAVVVGRASYCVAAMGADVLQRELSLLPCSQRAISLGQRARRRLEALRSETQRSVFHAWRRYTVRRCTLISLDPGAAAFVPRPIRLQSAGPVASLESVAADVVAA
jgi:hypothetical protein